MVSILKKGNSEEGKLIITPLVDADFEQIENILADKFLEELNPETVIFFFESLVLQRNIPEDSKLIDSILLYVNSQLVNPDFEFEICLIVGQLARNGSKKAIDFTIRIIQEGKESIAYAFSAVVTHCL
jgi:hypothetical protein